MVPIPRGFERYRTVQGITDGVQGGRKESAVLFVERLTYQDAGNYTCEVRNSSAPEQSPWLSASTELQLEGKDKHIHMNVPEL